jgi:DNA-binding transcriptional ArsR family regulator
MKKHASAVGPDVARVASLIGDAARARMLFALLDGPELPASELAARAGCSAQAASAHLAKLTSGGLLAVRNAGRQRLFRLSSPEIAKAIETLAAIAPVVPVSSLTQHYTMQRLREARSCYDHLAGRLGVALADALLENHLLREGSDAFSLTAKGERFLAEFAIDLPSLRAQRRSFARPCLDWTERRHHVAGSVGAALLDHFLAQQWLRRIPGERALRITEHGIDAFRRYFGITADP